MSANRPLMTILMVSLAGGPAVAASSFETYSAAAESGKQHWAVGDFGKAQAAFTVAEQLASTPAGKAQARLWIGHCAYQTGQYHSARKEYFTVLRIQGAAKDDLFHAYQHLGHTYIQAGLHIRGDALPFKELFGMWPHSYFPEDFYERRKQPRLKITAVMCDDKAEVDNCEIECFQSGIACQGQEIHVHHNRLHDIHAYPVLVSRSARMPLIEANAIDWAWHAIAAVDDMRASYEARFNVFREVAPNLWGQAISGQFAVDAHGQVASGGIGRAEPPPADRAAWAEVDLVPMPKKIRLSGRRLPLAGAMVILGKNPSPQDRIGAQWINPQVVAKGGVALRVLAEDAVPAMPLCGSS